VNLSFIFFFAFVALLLFGLVLALKRPRKEASFLANPELLEPPGQRHATHLPQICQSLEAEDYAFLSNHASQKLVRRVRRERRAVAIAYLNALREDFQSLVEMAKMIAALSPEVAAAQEFETARLTVRFLLRYQVTRWKLLAGSISAPQVNRLSELVSGLSVRIEAALKELGERAAAAADMASTVNRGGLHSV